MKEKAVRTGDGLDAHAQRHFLRNAFMIALENAGFIVAISFMGTTTVLPTFVTRLGGSAFVVGLVSTCQTAGWLLPQILGARLLAGKPRIMPYLLKPLYVGRPVLIVVAALTVLLGTGWPGLLIAVLCAAVLVFFAADGIASVAWFELVAKTISPDRRGRLFGSAQIAGGLGGMAVGVLVTAILKSPALPFPSGYALLFALSGAAFLVSIVPFLFVKEPVADPHAAASIHPTIRGFLASLLRIVREDRTFTRLISTRLLLGLAMSAFPFYILFTDRELAVSAERLGLFVSAQVFGGLFGGLAIGWLADHAGTRTVIRLSAILSAVVPCIALAMTVLRGASGPSLMVLSVALFVLIGVVGSTNFIGFMNYLMEVAPLEQRTSYVGLFNTLTGALMVAPPLLGWLLQAASFRALFLVAVAASVGSLFVSLGLRKPIRAR